MRRFLGGLRGGSSGSPGAYSSPAHTGPISGNNAVDPYRAEDVLTIKHGSNEYLFKYPVNTIASHVLTVGHLREKCAEVTGVDPKRLSLICAGRKLNDDEATLQSIGIEHGGKILAMGSNAPPPNKPTRNSDAAAAASSSTPPPAATPSPQPQKPKPPVGPAEKIETVRGHVISTLLPLVHDFIAGKGDENKRDDMHRRLTETIMAEVLKLDGVETDDPAIRARRKEVVKEVQGLLDALDKALADFNSS
ncbi:BAG domain-containing protein [Sphaerosporella brunnea]|uniref:BAG domain-containing protein n=1 Tax=Sphaerosporella brunnea TaxID=1250544 RepID=A0A5J5FAG2_9PEZI|nr:BAG domain-containing protein [Sphaerosporella brunnea]